MSAAMSVPDEGQAYQMMGMEYEPDHMEMADPRDINMMLVDEDLEPYPMMDNMQEMSMTAIEMMMSNNPHTEFMMSQGLMESEIPNAMSYR